MDTNEQLKEATDELTVEVRALSERLTAKELLYKRTRRLTQVALGIAALVGAVALVAVAALVRVNGVTDCISDWGAASSARQDALNDAAEEVAEKEGAADKALRTLVDYRGEENNADTDQAKRDYAAADDAQIAAEYRLQFVREQYPPPLIENYCSGVERDDSKDPKAPGE